MIEIMLEQGSESWHAFRKGKIGSSHAAICMEISPYCGIIDLWEEFVGLRQPKPQTESMKRGTLLEPIARQWYIEKVGIDMKPAVFQHPNISYMIASLDGISADRKRAIEIKCNGASTHSQCLQGIVPDHHFCQIQHIFSCVPSLELLDYVSFDGNEGVIIPIQRDESFISILLKEEARFWHCVQNFISPNLYHREYKEIEHEELCSG